MDLFGTAGIRGPVSKITPDLTAAVGRAAGMATDEPTPEFVIGRDARTSGPSLSSAVAAGLESAGATVRMVGQVPTPAIAYGSVDRHGVMVTASHNPPGYNGLKFFEDGWPYDAAAEDRIESIVDSLGDPVAWQDWSEPIQEGLIDDYRRAVTRYVRDYVDSKLDVRLVVDCGNGMASRVVPDLLRALGARVRTLNANPDGHEPARASKPTAESLADLRSFVASGPAQFGLGFDGDADRIVLVDQSGAVVHEDTVLAILAEMYVKRAEDSDPVVVTTPNASVRIDDRVTATGGRVDRVPLGRLTAGLGRERETVVFAGEPWKHLHPSFGNWIDGIVSAGILTALIASTGLEALRSPITELPYRKKSLECPDKSKSPVMDRLAQTLEAEFPDVTLTTDYGLRLEFSATEWCLVRPSGTEPYIRVYVEGESAETIMSTITSIVTDTIDAET